VNCQACHRTEYDQFARSRHALPAWAAVRGTAQLSDEQIAFGERFHPGGVDRPANALAALEGSSAIQTGCLGCHDIGTPNADGSIGSCTECHSRHFTSIALAREPQTCGQCHMGPDHSQLEIYTESKHGVLFNGQRASMNLGADPKQLTTADMPIPTCATCHMSGLDGLKVTHDTTERLSDWLFAEVSEQRPGYLAGQTEMQETCLTCHASTNVERFYLEAEAVVLAPTLGLRIRGRGLGFTYHAGLAVGYASVLLGLAGVLYHLDSQFFSQWTMRSLVYTAPFAAPVAYAGLGFLLLMNRMVPSGDAA
jgi:hydroxylamine dehydrogenase